VNATAVAIRKQAKLANGYRNAVWTLIRRGRPLPRPPEQFQSENALGPVHAYQKKPCFFGTLPRNSAGERIFVEPFKIVENTQDSANTP
ncbi:hypothetical protein, partial [Desulfovibrio sp. ZJ200]|uniref:hypothetical protein n=1 Tax=Desulfovibrio sp. ZJ200 TaxID=2709792 RepID=UPI00197E7A67